MTVRKKAIVSGRVQGVFFRDTCRRIAQREGVVGSAANLPDGTVEILLEGDEAAVERVLEWCRVGTDQSEVQRVDVSEERPTGAQGFQIL